MHKSRKRKIERCDMQHLSNARNRDLKFPCTCIPSASTTMYLDPCENVLNTSPTFPSNHQSYYNFLITEV